MKSSPRSTGPVKELVQLRRLRDVRVDAAEAEVRRKRDERDEAAAAVQARLTQIEDNRRRVEAHAAYAVGAGASDIGRMADLFSAFRERLDDTLERSEYALIDDEEALEGCEGRLQAQRQVWLREQSRRDGVDEMLQRSRMASARRADIQTEHDADELRRSTPFPPLLP